MQIHKVDQGSEEWFKLRLGKLTASNAQAIANNGKGLETLCFEKVAEMITGKIKTQYTNEDIERGNELEMMARNSYELETGNKVIELGFIELDTFTGCSPDGFIGADGLIEIKCKNDPLFARYLYEGKVDPEHNWQMQMQMFISGRKWVDYVVFNENFPQTTKILRVKRNEEEIKQLKEGIAKGLETMKKILDKVVKKQNEA